jgi:hypothetical protein
MRHITSLYFLNLTENKHTYEYNSVTNFPVVGYNPMTTKAVKVFTGFKSPIIIIYFALIAQTI